jgi:UDP-glucose 4-epimerase
LLNKLENYYVIGIDKDLPRAECYPDKFIQHDLTYDFNESIDYDICIHMASQVGGILFNNLNNCISINSQIDRTVSNIVTKEGNKKLIFMSSINVFENKDYFPESKILGTNQKLSNYAESKLNSELFFCNNISNFAIIRPTNVYGSSQIKKHSKFGDSHVIPDLLHKIDSNSDTITILGDGTQKRNFLHVSDLCSFIVILLNNFSDGFYNIRSDYTVSISELFYELIYLKNRKELRIEFAPEFMSFESISIYNFDITKVSKLGWKSKINYLELNI